MSAENRGALIVRVLRLLATLTQMSNGVTLEWLSLHLGVCERTVRRDLAALEEAHIPLEQIECDDGNKRWRLLPIADCPMCAHHRQSAYEMREHLTRSGKPIDGWPAQQA